MKNKLFLVAAVSLAAAGVFGAESTLNSYQVGIGWDLDLTHRMMLLTLQIGVILFAAKLGGVFASLFKLPSVLGELGAGIVIGPWALGGIGFGEGIFKYGLFRGAELKVLTDAAVAAGANTPFTVTPELYGICTIASVVLLFLSGIETNLKMFLKFAFAGSLVGIGGVFFSFLFGDFCAVYAVSLFPDLLGNVSCLAKLHAYVQQGELMKAVLDPGAMFMGIMSTATSVGITARILSERKKMDTEEGVTIMAGAVIDDVLGIIVLAIGMGIIGAQAASASAGSANAGVPWGSIGKTALQAIGVWLGGTVLGVVLARKISWLLKLFKSPVAIAILAFGLSLVIAGLFEVLGLTLIIGAYVIGLSLSRTDIKHLVQDHLQSVYTFLVPVFFCVMGMMVDVTAICSKPVLVFGGIYTVLAVVAKVIGCAIPSLFCGFNILGSLRVGAGMIPRGEVALIVAGIGLSNGYLTQEVFGIGILMTLVTTIVAPPTLVGLFISTKRGIRHPRQHAQGSRQVVFKLPSDQVAEIMAAKIIEEFHREGFITCQLSNDFNLSVWSVSMNAIEISLSRDGSSILVECTPEEESIVRQAWMEVISQMNELAHVLSSSIQGKKALEKIIAQTNSTAACDASKYMKNFVMIPKFRADSKQEAIEGLINAVKDAFPKIVGNVEQIKEAVFNREQSMPTGLDHGIAVPHGRTDAVSEIVGAIAIVDNSSNPNGTIADYETIDHSLIQVLVLTLAPSSEQAPYLQLMAYISKFLHNDDAHQKILKCKSEESLRNFFIPK